MEVPVQKGKRGKTSGRVGLADWVSKVKQVSRQKVAQ